MSEEHKKAPGLLDVARSVLWAMLGVQKQKNYERDFRTPIISHRFVQF